MPVSIFVNVEALVSCLWVFVGVCGVFVGVCEVCVGSCYYVYMYTVFVYKCMCSGVKLCPTCDCRGGVCVLFVGACYYTCDCVHSMYGGVTIHECRYILFGSL